jgi:hypothetical protein
MKDKDVLTKEEAKKMVLSDGDQVHTYYNLPFGLIGADWTKAQVFKAIDDAVLLKKTGPDALKMGHGLAVLPSLPCKQSDILFVETK